MAGKVRQTGGSLIAEAKLKHMYATMLRCRLLAEHARQPLQQSQRAALYDASLGQEAIATGFVIDLRPRDTIALAPRNSIAALVKGVALSEIVAQLYARRRPAGFPAREQLTVANRVALDNQQKNNTNVVVSFTSAAASAESRNCWDEALRFAATRSLPIIFVLENSPEDPDRGNHTENRTRNPQLRGLTRFTVDGNDVVAVYRVAYESLERVRQGGGPVLVESKTYRADGQALSPTERDPLTHMEQYLRAKQLFTTRWKDQLVHQFSQELDAAMRELAIRPPRYLRASQAPAND
jgi:TPP-dependent pyruvate/acetoin dehydrogenase alpha subunit